VWLIADASVLVGELTRARGHALVHHEEFDLAITEDRWSEVEYELRQRLNAMQQHGHLTAEAAEVLYQASMGLRDTAILMVPLPDYAANEVQARRRIPRDPDDWSTVALALTLEAAIRTHDHDFLGCGLPTCTTETLLLHLDA